MIEFRDKLFPKTCYAIYSLFSSWNPNYAQNSTFNTTFFSFKITNIRGHNTCQIGSHSLY